MLKFAKQTKNCIFKLGTILSRLFRPVWCWNLPITWATCRNKTSKSHFNFRHFFYIKYFYITFACYIKTINYNLHYPILDVYTCSAFYSKYRFLFCTENWYAGNCCPRGCTRSVDVFRRSTKHKYDIKYTKSKVYNP